MIIYKISLPNNKSYIGQTKNLKKRLQRHLNCVDRKVNRPLYDAINKYGKNSIQINILEECDILASDDRERFYIKKLNTLFPNGYNMDTGGNANKIVSNETKQKLSKLAKKRFSNIENHPMYGKTFSSKHKQNISNGLKGIFAGEKNYFYGKSKKGKLNPMYGVHRFGKKAPFYGKKHTEESKKLIGEMASQRIGNKNSFYGKTHTDETLLKLRKPIKCFDLNDNFIKNYNSLTEASKELNVDISKITLVCQGKRKHTKGYIFQYIK